MAANITAVVIVAVAVVVLVLLAAPIRVVTQ